MLFAIRLFMLLFLFFSALVFPKVLWNQNLSEWFNQKKTQKRYLIDQLMANQMYLEYLKKGYAIATNSLQTLGAIKQGSFRVHQLYFEQLKGVNPRIRQYGKVADVIAFQWRIVKEFQRFKKQTFSSFSTNQQQYFLAVCSRLLRNCSALLQQLYACLSVDFELNTAQRISRIDAIYEQMLGCREFSKVFFNQVRLLDLDFRKQQQYEQQLSRLLTIKLSQR